MIKVDRYLLNIALDALVKFVAKKSILPILANIYVGLDDDQLVLMATQLDDYTRINVPLVHVEPMPEFTVSAKEFLLVVKAIKKPHVTIEPHIHTLESGASIVTGVAVDEWTLSTIDTSEWPPVWQMITVSNALSFNGENLAWMVKSAARSANVDSARPALTALNMRISGEENTMNMVAADGFRLMIIGEWPDTTEGNPILSVPAYKINAMAGVFQYSDWVDLCWCSHQENIPATHIMLHFYLRNTDVAVQYTITTIPDTIPAYNQVIPNGKCTNGFIVGVGDLRHVINACKVAYGKKSGLVQVAITHNEVKMLAESYPLCAGPFSVNATQISLPRININDVDHLVPLLFAFDADFLLDAIAPYQEDNQVSIRVRGTTVPIEVIGNHGIYSLIMPMNIEKTGPTPYAVDERLMPIEEQRQAIQWMSELNKRAREEAKQAQLEQTLQEMSDWVNGMKMKGILPEKSYPYPIVFSSAAYDLVKLLVIEWNLRNTDGLFFVLEETFQGWLLMLYTVNS